MPGDPLDCQSFYPARLDGAVAGSSYLVRLGSGSGSVGTLTVSVAGPLPTPVLNPANGNHYRLVKSLSIAWDNARQRAENESFMGVPGHLAALQDADENTFVYGLGPDTASLCWIGGYQDVSAPDYVEPDGGWRWVTGEPWCYTNWSDGVPFDASGDENFLAYGCSLCGPEVWSDYARFIYTTEFAQGYVIEFETGPWCSAAAGTTYCSAGTHSLGAEARICAVGSPAVADEALCLSVVDLPPGRWGLFFFGADPAFVPLGNGFRCVVGSPRRMVPPQVADSSGRAALQIDLASPPYSTDFTPGVTRYFQFWYRDGAAGANLTDGVAVTFE